MMKKKLIILAGIILLLGVFAFASVNKNSVRLVNSEDFEDLIESEAFILQAHVPYMGEIEGTDLVMTDWENPGMYSDLLPKDKDKPIGVYCRSGRMSALTAEKLISMGYSNVYDLDGGMQAWKNSGRELVNLQ